MKILYVTTVSSTTGFFTSHINMLLDQGHSVDFACNVTTQLNQRLLSRGCKVFQVGFSRFPLESSNMRSYKKIKLLLLSEKYDVVHVHTPIAAAITRLAAKKFPHIKVMYTAHGFHFYRGAPLVNWIIYYPIEKYLARYTDFLITINQEDYKRAQRKFKAKKIVYVPGVGIDIKKFNNISVDRDIKRTELGIRKDSYVIVSVGELNKNKNHSAIIKALKKINNPNILYIICGVGPLKEIINDLVDNLELNSQVKLLGYRSDIPEILKASDLFVFPSFREGLSVSLMEAMAVGLPCVVSDIRGNRDLIDERGGILFDPYSTESCKSAIKLLLGSEGKLMGSYNQEKIKKFSSDKVLTHISYLYRVCTESVRVRQ
ncbi:MAG: glycosyltransferase family 4 protein [Clostridiaceae bacterium]